MNLLGNRLPRAAYAAAAGFLFLALFSVIIPGIVHAANPDQMPNRFIEMSDSGMSGGGITSGVGSGTNVDYQVGFDNPLQPIQSIIIDFCENDPLIGDTCDGASLTGFDLSSATLDASAGTINTGSGWSIAAQTATQIRLVGTAQLAAGTGQSFVLHGITNPDVTWSTTNLTTTFFARIYGYAGNDYTDGAGGAAYNDTSSGADAGSYDNYGGIALSVANTIQITARVMEQITFCVAGVTVQETTCSDPTVTASPPDLTLGQGTPQVLDASRVDTASAYTQVSTNALAGVNIRIRNGNSCGGLSADFGSSCSIPAINGGAAGVSNMTAGTAAFGLFVSDGSPNTTTTPVGSGDCAPTANYNDGVHNTAGNLWYGMSTDATTGSTTTYGDTICQSSAPINQVNNTLTFAATISNTTPAGIYTANMDLIATGTF